MLDESNPMICLFSDGLVSTFISASLSSCLLLSFFSVLLSGWEDAVVGESEEIVLHYANKNLTYNIWKNLSLQQNKGSQEHIKQGEIEMISS